jgi:hypothetical protein
MSPPIAMAIREDIPKPTSEKTSRRTRIMEQPITLKEIVI